MPLSPEMALRRRRLRRTPALTVLIERWRKERVDAECLRKTPLELGRSAFDVDGCATSSTIASS
jgi:hypothetical protein